MFKQSNKFRITLYLFCTAVLVCFIVETITRRKINSYSQNYILMSNIFFGMNMLNNILWVTVVFMLDYLMLKFNKPQMTRKDLKTGKDVSMLVFIQSKMQLRKIFDPDTDNINNDDSLVDD